MIITEEEKQIRLFSPSYSPFGIIQSWRKFILLLIFCLFYYSYFGEILFYYLYLFVKDPLRV